MCSSDLNFGTIVRCKRIDAGHVPEQRRRMLERVLFGEIDAVHPAVDRAFLGDGGDGRIHHRQIGIEAPEAARLDGGRRAPLLEAPDVFRPIAVAARVRRGLGADQPAADIGVERGRRDREFGGRFPGGKV